MPNLFFMFSIIVFNCYDIFHPWRLPTDVISQIKCLNYLYSFIIQSIFSFIVLHYNVAFMTGDNAFNKVSLLIFLITAFFLRGEFGNERLVRAIAFPSEHRDLYGDCWNWIAFCSFFFTRDLATLSRSLSLLPFQLFSFYWGHVIKLIFLLCATFFCCLSVLLFVFFIFPFIFKFLPSPSHFFCSCKSHSVRKSKNTYNFT